MTTPETQSQEEASEVAAAEQVVKTPEQPREAAEGKNTEDRREEAKGENKEAAAERKEKEAIISRTQKSLERQATWEREWAADMQDRFQELGLRVRGVEFPKALIAAERYRNSVLNLVNVYQRGLARVEGVHAMGAIWRKDEIQSLRMDQEMTLEDWLNKERGTERGNEDIQNACKVFDRFLENAGDHADFLEELGENYNKKERGVA